MKKFISLLSTFILLSFCINITTAFAEPRYFTQGLYSIDEAKLVTRINYNVRNTSTSKSLLMVIDANQSIQELLRLEPNSQKYILKPLNPGDSILIMGGATIEFS